MTGRVFFDTNVLVYAALGTGKDERKRERALALLESEDFGTSAQVLQEFFVIVAKKASRPFSPVQALEWIELGCGDSRRRRVSRRSYGLL